MQGEKALVSNKEQTATRKRHNRECREDVSLTDSDLRAVSSDLLEIQHCRHRTPNGKYSAYPPTQLNEAADKTKHTFEGVEWMKQ